MCERFHSVVLLLLLVLFLLLQLPMPLLLCEQFYCDQYFNSCNQVKANKKEREAKRRQKMKESAHSLSLYQYIIYVVAAAVIVVLFSPDFLSFIPHPRPFHVKLIEYCIPLLRMAKLAATNTYNMYKCWQGVLWNVHWFSFVTSTVSQFSDWMHVASIDYCEFGHQINENILFSSLWAACVFSEFNINFSHRVEGKW